MATPHIESNKGDIAKVVLMPGDPLRAKYIAEKYLQNVKLVNDVRNIYAYTGTYKGRRITVFASGMGNPSMGIYSYELYKYYDVDYIIRIGTAGAYSKELNLMDLLVVTNCYSESSYAKELKGVQSSIATASSEIVQTIKETAYSLEKVLKYGRVHCTDAFYSQNVNIKELESEYGCLAVEMETFALFNNAKLLNKNAGCILTISNSLVTNEETTSEQREKGLDEMIVLALESGIRLV